MELTLLDEAGLERLYQTELVRDFPKSELKPLRAMQKLLADGQYDPLLVEEGGAPLGYALVWLPKRRTGALLEYLGIFPDRRSQGLGSQALALLAARYDHLFGEAEAPDSIDPAENQLRRRRLDFYQRNGFRVLGYECALFGVHFNCLYRGPEPDDRKILALHRGVYADYFSPAHMERYIQLPLAPGEAIHPAPSWLEETSFS